MLTIITPCTRQQNLPKLYNSIKFDQLTQWIIVYDTSKNRSYTKLYTDHPKILEVMCDTIGVGGNPQRNYALDLVKDGFIYFLDDDTIMHRNFWFLLDTFNPAYFYTFDQIRERKENMICTLSGNYIKLNNIDTAMFIVHTNHIKTIRWRNDSCYGDGYFICDILAQNNLCHRYINIIGCYYNYLTQQSE